MRRAGRRNQVGGVQEVTVLFADVVHSMDIAAAVGAERLREIMTELADRAQFAHGPCAIAQRHDDPRQRVVQFRGFHAGMRADRRQHLGGMTCSLRSRSRRLDKTRRPPCRGRVAFFASQNESSGSRMARKVEIGTGAACVPTSVAKTRERFVSAGFVRHVLGPGSGSSGWRGCSAVAIAGVSSAPIPITRRDRGSSRSTCIPE